MREMPKTILDWGIPSENDRGMASQRGIMNLEGCPNKYVCAGRYEKSNNELRSNAISWGLKSGYERE